MNPENYNGAPQGVALSQEPLSRSTEFNSGISGGGSTHSTQQHAYVPSSVAEPIPGPNGESSSTYTDQKTLNYYRHN